MNQPLSEGRRFTRQDLKFSSGDSFCAAWLYLPEGVKNPPILVMGHGMGATREMGLDVISERFAGAGIATLAFTYRHFGTSGGMPRQILSVPRQLEDWDAAIEFAKRHPDVDGSRMAIWGSSFGGGHAITVASRHPELKAAISQCPFTDGLASAVALGVKGNLQATPVLVRDLVAKVSGRPPVMVPIAAAPGGMALMTAHDALQGYLQLVPPGGEFVNHVAARLMLDVLLYRPGRSLKDVECPILVCVSNTDTVTPPERTIAYARRAPRAVTKRYDAGHFDFYQGATLDQLSADQISFLKSHL